MSKTLRFLLYTLVLSSLASVADAIVTNEVQTRRLAFSNTLSSAASLTFATEAIAAPNVEERVVIPGTGMRAPLKNLIINEDGYDDNDNVINASSLMTQLGKSRIGAKELAPLSPSLVPFATDNELYYDPFLFGSWDVTSTLKRKVYPYGTQYLPSNSLFDGSPRNRMEKPGDTTAFEMHYFSSSEPTTKSKAAVDTIEIQKNSLLKSKIIADRAFNAKSMNAAYKQLSQIEDVVWDYKKDPTRVTIQFSSLGEDFQPLGQRRGEVYISSRKTENGRDLNTNEAIFCSSERARSVLLIPGDVVVSDTETITEYRVVDGSGGNHVKGLSRIAVYLTPNPNSREGLLWQDVGGKAVAFFDYDIDLRRKLEDSRAYVHTPNGGAQYIADI